MPNSPENTVRVTARIPESIQQTHQKAAELSGATLNQFMVQAALKEAKKIIEDEGLIILSEIDADKEFNLIEDQPEPHSNIKAA